jgi:magnesium chelatase family protein
MWAASRGDALRATRGVAFPEALAAAMTRLSVCARGHDRVVKMARTIADPEGADAFRAEHLADPISRGWTVSGEGDLSFGR